MERVSADEKDGWFSKKEQLKEACWNGLTPEILPECFYENANRSLSLWEINDANTFINLEFCEGIQRIEERYSLNPYLFMQFQSFN